jgi:pyruvate/2-oxoacid:ferredoxin oxidoreductase beta subunit
VFIQLKTTSGNITYFFYNNPVAHNALSTNSSATKKEKQTKTNPIARRWFLLPSNMGESKLRKSQEHKSMWISQG